MSDIIHLLPDSVANQIAAGEVIQRPASVIKELVENAVDAGATDIRIYIKDAGRTLIQVIDNGKGMTETDARMAFERHATSKISQAADLFSLHTMGFRGEALPSICAISQIELHTRTGDDQIGTRLTINGKEVSQEPSVCEKGTNIMVKNLFFNVPARRKFLKSDNVELTNIMREFERLALVNYGIRLMIDRGTGKMLDLRPASFKQRIGDIWKNNLNLQLLPIEVDTSLVKITGFVSRPEHARKRNALQYFIVNGRNMRHPYFHRGILSCFEALIPADAQPCYFIRFEVNPDTIDVNIHPTKNEIKFENEQQIWTILTASVRAALGKFAAVPSIDFNEEALPLQPLPEGETPTRPVVEIPSGYNPFERYSHTYSGAASGPARRPVAPAYRPTKQSGNWESLYDSFMRQASAPKSGTDSNPAQQAGLESELRLEEQAAPAGFIQFALKYIITTTRQGILIIDQHRAHVKILYEKIMSSSSDPEAVSQRVMFAETMSLDSHQREAFAEVEDELTKIGFRIEYVGEDQFQITGIPSSIQGIDPSAMLTGILDSVSDESTAYGTTGNPSEGLRSRLALMMARSAAIRGGTRLSLQEMEHIVGQLFSLPDPSLTPEGNPIFKTIDERSLGHLFS